RSFSVGLRATNNNGAFVILHCSRQNFRGRGGEFIYQNDQGAIPKYFTVFVFKYFFVSRGSNLNNGTFFNEKSCNVNSCSQRATAIIAKVQNESFHSFFL